MAELIKGIKKAIDDICKEETDNKIFIVGHDCADFDSIAASIGLSTLFKEIDKQPYIVINDPDVTLDTGVKKIKYENRFKHNIIFKEQAENLISELSSIVVVDVNNANRVCLNDYLEKVKNVVVIDHHHEDPRSIKTKYSFIDSTVSSVSEVVARLLCLSKVSYSKEVASYLLAGIILDTKRYIKNTTSITHDTAKKLMLKGADKDYINDLFLAEYSTDERICSLIYNGNTQLHTYEMSLFKTSNISYTFNCNNPEAIYKETELAKAADKMLKYKIDACFVLGYTNESAVKISARSKGHVDVGAIMTQIGGGGNKENAGAKIFDANILDVLVELQTAVQNILKTEENTNDIVVKKITMS